MEIETTNITKNEALARYLAVDKDNINIDEESGVLTVSIGEKLQMWLVLTGEEADAMVRDQILNSLWAFSSQLISAHTRNGISAEAISTLKKMQLDEYPGVNEIVAAMIVDMDRFVQDVIGRDGRGLFLSCDGDEVDLGDGFFGYQLGGEVCR